MVALGNYHVTASFLSSLFFSPCFDDASLPLFKYRLKKRLEHGLKSVVQDGVSFNEGGRISVQRGLLSCLL